ncbi:MAG: zf-HC2 domain-containing protein [Acidimicrobiia bacterium]
MTPLIHRQFRRSVGPFVDGELPQLMAGAVASHLDECDDCSDEARLIMRLKKSLPRLALAGKINYADEFPDAN